MRYEFDTKSFTLYICTKCHMSRMLRSTDTKMNNAIYYLFAWFLVGTFSLSLADTVIIVSLWEIGFDISYDFQYEQWTVSGGYVWYCLISDLFDCLSLSFSQEKLIRKLIRRFYKRIVYFWKQQRYSIEQSLLCIVRVSSQSLTCCNNESDSESGKSKTKSSLRNNKKMWSTENSFSCSFGLKLNNSLLNFDSLIGFCVLCVSTKQANYEEIFRER